MPFKTQWTKDLTYVESEKQVTGTDIIDAIRGINENTQHPPSRHQIWDYSNTTELTLNTTDMRTLHEISQTCPPLSQKASIAIVAPAPSVNFRLQALVHFIDNPHCETQIFRAYEDAEGWLQTLP